MNTLIIYGYEEQSVIVLLDEDGVILESDYANGMMWTIENSLIKIFGEVKGITLYNSLATDSQIHLIDYNLGQYIIYDLDSFSFNIIKKGL
ncbi:MAG: hypothetical protein SOV80_02730 [Bacilli bacterium]|nr:hypothetical protein [bacterium]MDY2697124.1 hypothetical protein [Bacilli bacterium]